MPGMVSIGTGKSYATIEQFATGKDFIYSLYSYPLGWNGAQVLDRRRW